MSTAPPLPPSPPASPSHCIDARSDEALLRAAAAGDPAAFAALHRQHASIARRLALRLVREPGLADDVVQDAFLSLWRSAYDPRRGSVRTLLLTIVRHRAIDVLRREQRHGAHTWGDPAEAEQLPSALRTEEYVQERDQARRLRRLVADLPQPQRQTLELSYFGGLSQSEIARRLGQPLGTIKSRARLGLDGLRGALADAA